MTKEEKVAASNEVSDKKDFPNMGQKPPQPIPPKKRKKKKLLRTPSHIIRICMIWVYVIILFMLTSPFITASFYITEDSQVTADVTKAYLHYSTQEQIDKLKDDLEAAIDGLEKSDAEVEEYQETIALPTANMNWQYHVAEGINADELVKLIEEARGLDKRYYTEESVKALNSATLEAQKSLCATVTVTCSIFQLIFGGNVNGTDTSAVGGLIASVMMIFVLAVLPLAGFFITCFDKRRHIKNVYALLCSLFCLLDIFIMVYPNIALGAVLTIFAYIALFLLAIGGLYAKQQEDYIVRHPEKEAEFTEKHPQFVKALINYKAVTMPVVTEKEKTLASAQNAKKHGRSRK